MLQTKRIIVFLFGCILARTALVVIAKNINKEYLKNMGYDSRSIFDFVDKEKMADDLLHDEGYFGSMNPYNNDYDIFEFNGEEYVVMQTNG